MRLDSTEQLDCSSDTLMKLAALLIWEYQEPGTRAGPGLISWQQASNWVRTVSGPWLWPYRDWITPSGDSKKRCVCAGVCAHTQEVEGSCGTLNGALDAKRQRG